MICIQTIPAYWIRVRKFRMSWPYCPKKYSVSERKVYALVKRFQSDCKTLAV